LLRSEEEVALLLELYVRRLLIGEAERGRELTQELQAIERELDVCRK